MKLARLMVCAAAAVCTLAMQASASGIIASHPGASFLIGTALHSEPAASLSAASGFHQLPGPAQVHQAWRYYRTRRLTVSTTSLNFGTVSLNTVSTQSITLSSTGSGSVTVSALTISGLGYTVAAPALPLTLAPGQSATVHVSFRPAAAGASAGALAISSNAYGGSTTQVSLSGSGAGIVSPALSLSTTSLNFGSVTLGSPVSQTVTLTSTGSSAVTVSAASLTGAGFTISGATFPVTLNPTVAIKVTVQFNPTVAGTASGTLTFTSNSSTGSTSVVVLSGSGTAVQHQVTLSWAAPASSPAPVTGYNVYRAAAGATSYQRVNASADSQTRYVDTNVASKSSYSYYVKSVDSAGAESAPSNAISVTVP
jgi:Abnormal spindle-like microcephaly-assoc'd, ASPM-SPD-2-Hydin/Fibronectin type III domain